MDCIFLSLELGFMCITPCTQVGCISLTLQAVSILCLPVDLIRLSLELIEFSGLASYLDTDRQRSPCFAALALYTTNFVLSGVHLIGCLVSVVLQLLGHFTLADHIES